MQAVATSEQGQRPRLQVQHFGGTTLQHEVLHLAVGLVLAVFAQRNGILEVAALAGVLQAQGDRVLGFVEVPEVVHALLEYVDGARSERVGQAEERAFLAQHGGDQRQERVRLVDAAHGAVRIELVVCRRSNQRVPFEVANVSLGQERVSRRQVRVVRVVGDEGAADLRQNLLRGRGQSSVRKKVRKRHNAITPQPLARLLDERGQLLARIEPLAIWQGVALQVNESP